MDSVTLLGRVVRETQRVVDNISEDQLGRPTLCEEWTVRDVLNHITGGATMFALSAEQGSVPDDRLGDLLTGDNLGDDFKRSFREASEHALGAFQGPGVLDRIVKLPFGEMPAGIALDIAVFDVATHACDLARATGQAITDDDLLQTALDMGRKLIGPEFRVPGVFAEERNVADTASLEDKLLAFAGRRV